jgi:hypothetical protein
MEDYPSDLFARRFRRPEQAQPEQIRNSWAWQLLRFSFIFAVRVNACGESRLQW